MKSFLIFLAIMLGILLPAGHHLTFLIRYNLMIMLFFAFLNVHFRRDFLHLNHFIVLIFNLLLPILAYFLIRPFDQAIALSAFVIGIAPTAAGAPVITAFLRSRVEFVTASVLVTSPVIALALPFLLPQLITVEGAISTWEVLKPVAAIVFIPLLLSQLLRKTSIKATEWVNRGRNIPFYLFLLNVYIACASATRFILEESTEHWSSFLIIALVIGGICILQFQIGEWIGRKNYRMESSMALGRKNTMFSIWVALTFISPAAALGPIFYILWQNAYNSWQMYVIEKQAPLKG